MRVTASRRGAAPDRGASTVELAIIMPVVLVVMLLIVQLALVFHARQIADGAARAGARVARAAGVGANAGDWQRAAEAQARARVALIGKKVLENPTVRAWQVGDQRGVTVTGDVAAAVPLLPGMTFTINARSGGPIECFRPDDGTGDCQ
ncbi:TadE/TadG family type IV pilus assembly protein [Microbispora corallina]|uniref:TadE/TadG family type IV pilus assembly protein n=1 Tax=Microbispora corallina TaxID=83302 RepID=UPI00194EDFB3|nr:TadE/TadG family type IV pilus assembly protein [Microbispora corallina]